MMPMCRILSSEDYSRYVYWHKCPICGESACYCKIYSITFTANNEVCIYYEVRDGQ